MASFSSSAFSTSAFSVDAFDFGVVAAVEENKGGFAKRRQRIEVAKSRQPEWDLKRRDRDLFKKRIEELYDRIERGYEIEEDVAEVAQEYVVREVKKKRVVQTIDYDRLFGNAAHLEAMLLQYEIMQEELVEEEAIVILLAL